MEYQGDNIREYHIGGTRRTHRDIRNLKKILTGKAKEQEFLLISTNMPSIWRNNIKVNLRKTGYEGVDLIYLSKDRLEWWNFVDTINLRFPKMAGNFWTR